MTFVFVLNSGVSRLSPSAATSQPPLQDDCSIGHVRRPCGGERFGLCTRPDGAPLKTMMILDMRAALAQLPLSWVVRAGEDIRVDLFPQTRARITWQDWPCCGWWSRVSSVSTKHLTITTVLHLFGPARHPPPLHSPVHRRRRLSPVIRRRRRQTLASSALARTAAPESSPVVLEACRRNTKKEKRQRNKENMRQFKKGDGKKVMGKKAPSRKKLALKAASAHEKEREAEFMTRLFQCVAAPPSPAQPHRPPRARPRRALRRAAPVRRHVFTVAPRRVWSSAAPSSSSSSSSSCPRSAWRSRLVHGGRTACRSVAKRMGCEADVKGGRSPATAGCCSARPAPPPPVRAMHTHRRCSPLANH